MNDDTRALEQRIATLEAALEHAEATLEDMHAADCLALEWGESDSSCDCQLQGERRAIRAALSGAPTSAPEKP
jgi:hypothetical protein